MYCVWGKCVWGKPVAVAVWTRQSALGWSVSGGGMWKEGCFSEEEAPELSWDLLASLGWPSLMGSEMWWWCCTDVSVQCIYKYIISCTYTYMVHTYIYIHERVCTMYIQIYIFINIIMMYAQLQQSSSWIMNLLVHVYTCSWIHKHVHTWLYHVQTGIYSFAISCPECEDSRLGAWWCSSANRDATISDYIFWALLYILKHY
jgi:hypothetical protein